MSPLRMLKPAILATILLAGCASMAPDYQKPALPVAASFPSDAQPGAPKTEAAALSGQPAIAVDWRAYFTAPQLQQMITLALAHNRDLRLAALRVQETRAAYGLQRAQGLPAIGVDAGASRTHIPAALSPSGRAVTASQYQVALGFNGWEIDFWGRLQSLKDAALQSYLATDEARRALTLSLVAEVANSYFTLRELDERLVLARRSIASREESLRIFTRRVEVGSASRLELTQVQTLATQARMLGAQLAQQRATQAHGLALLIGGPVDMAPTVKPLDDDAVLHMLAVGLPSDLLVNRPDILAAEHRLRAAHAHIGAARAAFFPRIALTTQAGTASLAFDGLFEGAGRTWTFAPSMSLPIFDGGRRQSALDLSEVQRKQAVANYDKTVQTAFRDVADALSARQWLIELVRIGQEALAAQTERARLAKLRYDNGAAAFLEVLDAQRDLLAAEQALVQTRRALLSARVGLYAALGGGAQDLPTTAHP
jgi:multidrug efflux system outer membrane protein